MSDLKATVAETKTGFHVEGYEKIEYDFTFMDGVFNPANPQLANCYERWGRCLAVMDLNIYNVYGKDMQKYFDHYNLPLTVHNANAIPSSQDLSASHAVILDLRAALLLIRRTSRCLCSERLSRSSSSRHQPLAAH